MKKYRIMVSCLMLFLGVFGLQRFSRAAEIIYLEGNVQVQPASGVIDDVWQGAAKGMKVSIGDSIRTARRSRADIALDDAKKNIIRIDPKSLVVLSSASPATIDRLDLSRGKIYANMEDIKAGLKFEVSTPSAVAGVRGSSYSVYSEKESDEVQAFKDNVYLKTFDGDKKELSDITIPEGFKTFVERFEGPSSLIQLTTRDFDRFDSLTEDLSDHAAGRENARAEREAQREAQAAERAKQKEDQKSALEKKTEQSDSQGDISDQLEDTKTLIEERNADQAIDDFRVIHEEYMP